MIPNTSVRKNPKVLLMTSFGGFPHSSLMYSRLDELVRDLAARRLRGHTTMNCSHAILIMTFWPLLRPAGAFWPGPWHRDRDLAIVYY